MGTLQESVGSSWAETFELIVGNFNSATKLWTHVNDTLGGMIGKVGEARNKMLKVWQKGGGRDIAIEALTNAWDALLGVLGPVHDAFRDVFPAKTGKDLLDMTKRFAEFTEGLIPSKEAMASIRDIASGVFSVFSIVGTVISGVVAGFKALFEAIGGGNGDFLGFAASVGRMVTGFSEFLKKSGVVKAFFVGLGKLLAVPIRLIVSFAKAVGGIFDGFKSGVAEKVGASVDGVGKRFSALEAVGDKLRGAFEKVGDFFGSLGSRIGKALVGIGDAIADAFTSDSFGPALDVINTALLGGIVLLIKNFFSKGVDIDLTGGLFDGIKKTLGEATSAFQNMQQTLKADILLKIAGAIAVMAGALFLLSMIDPGALTKALAAMTAGFGILTGALATLMKVMGPLGVVQIYVVSSAITKLAISILILALALKVMSSISFGDMLRGLIGLGITMKILTKTMVPMAAGSKGMARAAWSIMIMGVALNILALALKVFASMSWEEMIKGLAGLTGTLLALAIGLKLMPPMQAEAIGLVALGVAMNLLAISMKVFATMTWEEMAKGLLMLAGSLVIIAAAINMMPKTMMLQAVALVAVAGAMTILSGALKVMGGMSWEEVAKGLVTMAGAMLILAVGLNAMGVMGFIGAAALVVAAGALSILVPVLATLGSMSIGTIVTALGALAGVFIVLGLAGLALAPVSPVILALGVALLLLGAGLALAGAGALAAATAFGIVVGAGIAGAKVLSHILGVIIAAIPKAMAAFGKGVVQFAVAIGQGAPRIAAAFGRVLSNLIDQVIRMTPKLGKMFLVMLNTALRVIVIATPMIVNAGLNLIISFLDGISRKIPRIVDLAADIIVKFINGIARNLERIIQAGVNLIIKFIEGITQAIRNNSERLGEAGADLGIAVAEGIAGGIAGAVGRIKDAAMDAARGALDAAKGFLGIHSPSRVMRDQVGKRIGEGMALGIAESAPEVESSMRAMGRTAMAKMNDTMSSLGDAFALDPNLSPTVSPVLDLAGLTRDANKMSSILSTSPITTGVSYNAAADISAMTQASAEADSEAANGAGTGDTYHYEQHLHSPTALDSVKIYRSSRSLVHSRRRSWLSEDESSPIRRSLEC